MRSKLSCQAVLPPISSFRACQLERGFSLIEVLITVFILCLGLLGVGGLQYLATKSNQSALSRAIATEYAYQMLDFIRSNPAVTLDITDANRPIANPGVCANAILCNPNAFVFTMLQSNAAVEPPNTLTITNWMNDWAVRLRRDLPGARAAVCPSASQNVAGVQASVPINNCNIFPPWQPASENRYYVVTIRWSQPGTFSDAEQQIILVGEVL